MIVRQVHGPYGGVLAIHRDWKKSRQVHQIERNVDTRSIKLLTKYRGFKAKFECYQWRQSQADFLSFTNRVARLRDFFFWGISLEGKIFPRGLTGETTFFGTVLVNEKRTILSKSVEERILKFCISVCRAQQYSRPVLSVIIVFP